MFNRLIKKAIIYNLQSRKRIIRIIFILILMLTVNPEPRESRVKSRTKVETKLNTRTYHTNYTYYTITYTKCE